ncbi:MAG: ANTAR domain-containing protein [Clostridia bacterium]|nr:ANTAR domain-containing protein [Clostridia bacterium]NCC69600.1 ANTAR domain-containing protein [Clostridia bacterium]
MIRTVVAIENEKLGILIYETLEKNSIPVRYRCRNGAETIRAIKKMGGGVVVCGYKLPDTTADSLSFDLHDTASLLVVAKPQQLALCENEDSFKLPVPVKVGELIGSVNMLIQMDRMRYSKSIPRRSPEDVEIILRAKELLMARNNLSEDAAYKCLQRKSMETCAKLTDTAKLIIAAFG